MTTEEAVLVEEELFFATLPFAQILPVFPEDRRMEPRICRPFTDPTSSLEGVIRSRPTIEPR